MPGSRPSPTTAPGRPETTGSPDCSLQTGRSDLDLECQQSGFDFAYRSTRPRPQPVVQAAERSRRHRPVYEGALRSFPTLMCGPRTAGKRIRPCIGPRPDALARHEQSPGLFVSGLSPPPGLATGLPLYFPDSLPHHPRLATAGILVALPNPMRRVVRQAEKLPRPDLYGRCSRKASSAGPGIGCASIATPSARTAEPRAAAMRGRCCGPGSSQRDRSTATRGCASAKTRPRVPHRP